MISTTPTNPWIARVRPTNGAVLRLFCFPYAGGGAAAYRPWSNELPSQIDVCAVQLPGRETRLREAPFTRIGPLVETLERALRPYCDLPAAYFGHSMGALIAFELARQQRRLGRPGPVRLFVSGHHGPQLPDPHKPLHRLPKDEFVAELRRLNGTPEVVLQNAEIMELLLPYLRANLEITETYDYAPEEPLTLPISAFGGLQDSEASPEEVQGWQEQTRSTYKLRTYPGDHFFIHSVRSQITRAVADDLAALVTRRAAPQLS